LYTRLVADFSGWLSEKNITTEQITLEHTERYLDTAPRVNVQREVMALP